MEETRALLDALMGPNRNRRDAPTTSAPDFLDRNICKNYLVGFCPHDWFSMPKRQLPPCHKIHSEVIKDNFEKHSEVKKYRSWFEEDFLHYLQPLARDCDAFIVRERAKCRPKSSGGKGLRMPPDVKEKFDDLESRYAEAVKRSEEAADTSLSKSKDLMGQALVLGEDIDTMKAKYTSEFAGEDICEVCGVKYPLGSGGAEWHDKQSHMKGKTHQGFATIRSTIDKLLSKRKEWETWRDERRTEYDPLREKEREIECPKVRERLRERERERSDHDRERNKPRDRDRERGVDRDRSATRRRDNNRNRDRTRRGKDRKSRERSHSRSRSRTRSRSRSRSRSKSRSRSRSRRKKESARGVSGRSSSASSRRKQKDKEKHRENHKGKTETSSDDEQPDDEKDGITVLEEDLPEFWARIQKIKGDVRNEAVAVLSTATKERLERWLVARVRQRNAKVAAFMPR